MNARKTGAASSASPEDPANSFSVWRRAAVPLALLKRVVEEWNTDNAMSWSASVAFYTLLSLAPLLVLTVAIAGFVYGKHAAQSELISGLRDLVSPDISPAVQILLTRPQEKSTGLIAGVFGGVVLFFGASSMLAEVHDALNAIWHVPVDRNATRAATLFRLLKERLYSFGVIIGCGILLLASLAVSSWLGTLETIFGWGFMASNHWLHLFVFVLSFVGIAFVFTAIYKIIPDVDLNWSDVTVGGLTTAVLFVAGRQLIGLYVDKTGLGSAYGAAGSVIVVLVWVYYSAQVFFLGAEFTKVYAETFGSRKGRDKSADGTA
jgi:YihY family inner membrane protein